MSLGRSRTIAAPALSYWSHCRVTLKRGRVLEELRRSRDWDTIGPDPAERHRNADQ